MKTIDSALKELSPTDHYCVAFSGGLDSTVLLHAVSKTLPNNHLRALHIHHGLSPNADQWRHHCEQICTQLGVELDVLEVTVTPQGKGLEDAARQARYRAFEQTLKPGETLLTAHHADDQMETLLLRLARGSGTKGLGAMATQRPLGRGELRRPLLGITRAQLEAYATQHQLRWIDDESNADEHFDRNYLRHRVVPALRERWPAIADAWGQSAALCRETDELLQEYAREDLARLTVPAKGPVSAPVLSLSGLAGHSLVRRHAILRTWLADAGARGLSRIQMAEVDHQLLEGREDASAEVCWEGGCLRRFRDGLYLLPVNLPPVPAQSLPVNLESGVGAEVVLPGGGRFRLVPERAGRSRLAVGLTDLRVGWRSGGERCRPAGRRHSQTLKKLLQAYDVPPWWRERVPLLYSEETLVAVGDLWVCAGCEAAPGGAGYRLEWQSGPPSSASGSEE